MSLRASSWAWAIPAGPNGISPVAKLVLLAIADHADETGFCWPSVPRMVAMSGLSERTVRGTLTDLQKAGVMSIERRDGHNSRYRLNFAYTPEPLQEMHPCSTCTPESAAPHPCSTCTPPLQELHHTPAAAAPEPSITTIEPPVNRQEVALRAPAAKAETRGHRLPEDWAPSRGDCEFAQDLGLRPDDVAAEFRDYWNSVPGAKGRKLDWSGTFRNSCRMQAKRRPTTRQPESKLAWMLNPRPETYQ